MEKIMPVIDLKKLYVALLKKDDEEGAEFEKPIYLPGLRELGFKPNISTDEFYAEGINWDNDMTLSNVDIEIDITNLSTEHEAMLLGHTLAKDGGIIYKATDIAPEFAIMFQTKTKYEDIFYTFYRCTFTPSDEGYKQKEGKADHQTKKLIGKAMPLKFNELYKYKKSSSEGANATTWFSNVVIPQAKELEKQVKKIEK